MANRTHRERSQKYWFGSGRYRIHWLPIDKDKPLRHLMVPPRIGKEKKMAITDDQSRILPDFETENKFQLPGVAYPPKLMHNKKLTIRAVIPSGAVTDWSGR